MSDEIRNLVEQQSELINNPEIEQSQEANNEGVIDDAASIENKEELTNQQEGQMPSEDEDSSLNLNNIDPNVREYIEKLDDVDAQQAVIEAHNKMRANFDRKQTELGENNKIVNKLSGVAKKYGVDNLNDRAIEEIENSIAFTSQFQQNPAENIKALAQEYGITLSDNNSNNSIQNSPSDEDIHDFTENELFIDKKYGNEIKKLKNQLASYEQQNQHKLESEINLIVSDLKNETDSDGNKVRPYFDQVEQDMNIIIQNNFNNNPRYASMSNAEILQEAYESAVFTNKDLRNKIINSQTSYVSQNKVNRAKKLNDQTFRSKKVTSIREPIKSTGNMETDIHNLVSRNFEALES